MQEAVEEKSLNICVTTTRLTGQAVIEALRMSQMRKMRGVTYKHGRQRLRSLMRQGMALTNVRVLPDDMRDFQRVAKRYGIDFAVRRDSSFIPPRYFVFFKTTDMGAMTALIKEVARRQAARASRPSVRERITELAREVKKAVQKIRKKVLGR